MELTWQKVKVNKNKITATHQEGAIMSPQPALTADEQTLNDVWNERKYKRLPAAIPRECLARTACVFFPVRSSLLMKCPANYFGHDEENENMR
jgi:hypothetical protein